MKTSLSVSTLLRVAGLGILMWTTTASTAHAGDVQAVQRRWETLQAINWVENPTNSPRPGSNGELGPYQFRRATWRMYTKRPFAEAVDRRQADQVAVKHYEWLKRGLERNGLEATTYRIALAWNAGLTAVLQNAVGGGSRRYAEQVQNLAEHLQQREVAAGGHP